MKMDTTIPKARCEEIANQAVVEGTKELQEVIDSQRVTLQTQQKTIMELNEEVQAQKEANRAAMQTIERLRDMINDNNREIPELRERIKQSDLRITQLIGVVANQAQALAKG